MKLPCIHDSTISDAAEKRYTFPVQAVQKGMTYSDLTGHHRITDGSNIAGVPLYLSLIHISYPALYILPHIVSTGFICDCPTASASFNIMATMTFSLQILFVTNIPKDVAVIPYLEQTIC